MSLQKMNTSVVRGNFTSVGKETSLSITTQVGMTGAYAIVFVAAIFGNAFVLHVLRSQRNMRTAFNYLIANMAIADMIDAVFSIPYLIHMLFYDIGWFPGPFAVVLCKAINYFMNVSIAVSVLTMAIITVDRYLATVHVLKQPFSLRTVKRLIFMVWAISSGIYVYEIYKFRVVVLPSKRNVCVPYVSDDRDTTVLYFNVEMIVKFILTYAIPFTLMASLYTIIIIHLWKRKHIGEGNNDSYRKLKAQKKTVIIKLVAMVALFAFCWIPVHVAHFLSTFNTRAKGRIPISLILVIYWLAHANTAINPCIYLMLTKQSRRMIRDSLGSTKKKDFKRKKVAAGSLPAKHASRLTMKTHLKKKDEVNDISPLCGSQTDTAV